MKKYIITFLFLLLPLWLSWCIFNDDTVNNTWLKLVTLKQFDIYIPENWENILDIDKVLPKPKDWIIELATVSQTHVNWYSNNIIILSSNLNKIINSKDYSIINNIWSSNEYYNYRLIESKDFSFNDQEQSMLYIFSAKYNLKSPVLNFLQTAYICNNKAYLITLSITSNIVDFKKYEDLISTFKCNN